jgi:general L-amino acid transport system permease protein
VTQNPQQANGRLPARRPSGSQAMSFSLSDPVVRSIIYQVLAVAGILSVGWYLVSTTMENLEARQIASGFGFLDREAGFGIGDNVIPYSPADSYFRALIVGLFNTLVVAVIGVVLATILGTIIGIARLSRNWLISRAALTYIEFIRNLPLLLQLFFWWSVFRDIFPGPREALNPLPGVFLSSRGAMFPVPAAHPAHLWMFLALLLGIALAWAMARWAHRRQMATGQQFPVFGASAALIIGLPLVVFLAAGAPTELSLPELRGFNFAGGVTVTPELAALVIGLVTYTAAFIAEIVRSGIIAVSHGQTEAAAALGLPRGLILRLVVLPQALRVIVPPMTSQYLNLTKNSSLAVAIGYPDIVSIANTTINQTGQAVEGIAIIMLVFLTISLSISAFMNWYNKHIALVER